MRLALAITLLGTLVTAPCLAMDQLPKRASLRDFPGVVDVVVVSSADQIDIQRVRDAALKRLRRHGLLIEWAASTEQPRLVIEVEAFHDTPRSGDITHHTYYVDIHLKEPVSTERAPSSLFMGTTWSSRARLATFGQEVDRDPLVDSIIQGVDAFIRDALMDRQLSR